MPTSAPPRQPEMAYHPSAHELRKSTDGSFPVSAYLLANSNQRQPEPRMHTSHMKQTADPNNPDFVTTERQPSQSTTSTSRRWSKDSEKGRDSLILGRPVFDNTITPPQRTIVRQLAPSPIDPNFTVSSAPSPILMSPRSGALHSGRHSKADYEERGLSPMSPHSHRSRLDSVSSILESQHCRCRQDEGGEVFLESKAMDLLIYLSFPAFVVSMLILAWTLVSLVIALILSPFRLCSRSSPRFGASLTSFLDPALRLQLALIHSKKARKASTTCHRHSHHSHHNAHNPDTKLKNDSEIEHKTAVLLAVHLLSPLVSLGVAVGAWTAAVFWFYAAILGDPAGNDKPQGYNDGKASVLGVRAWWETWLTRPMK